MPLISKSCKMALLGDYTYWEIGYIHSIDIIHANFLETQLTNII